MSKKYYGTIVAIFLSGILGLFSLEAKASPPDQLNADQLKRTQIPGIVSTLPDDTVRLMGFSGATPSANQIPVFSDGVGGMNSTPATLDPSGNESANSLSVTGSSGNVVSGTNFQLVANGTFNFTNVNASGSVGYNSSGVLQINGNSAGSENPLIVQAFNGGGSGNSLLMENLTPGQDAVIAIKSPQSIGGSPGAIQFLDSDSGLPEQDMTAETDGDGNYVIDFKNDNIADLDPLLLNTTTGLSTVQSMLVKQAINIQGGGDGTRLTVQGANDNSGEPVIIVEHSGGGADNSLLVQNYDQSSYIAQDTKMTANGSADVIALEDNGTSEIEMIGQLSGSNYQFYVSNAQTGNFGLMSDVTNGSLNINNANEAPSAVLNFLNGHIKAQQSTPTTATVNAKAGTGASCSVVTATDSAGGISLTTTGTASSAGDVCDIVFNMAYNLAPHCSLVPTNANAANFSVVQGVFLSTSTADLTVNFATADAVGRTYTWDYLCVETQ